MSQAERRPDLEYAIKLQIKAQLLMLQTSMPVRITAYDPVTMSATCQPLIKARVTDQYGVSTFKALPQLIFCPVIMISGAVFTLAFPPKVGAEGLAIFSSRAIDNWWVTGGVYPPVELRLHDLSDGFVIVGPRARPNALVNPSDNDQIRSEDGSIFIDLSLDAIALQAPAFSVATPTGAIDLAGNTAVDGNLDVSAGASGTAVDSTGKVLTFQNGILINLG
jgi:hypothetical protein